MEALVRACVVLVGTPEEVTRIRQDEFRVNFKTDGARIDKALGTGTLLEDYLKDSRNLLHSTSCSPFQVVDRITPIRYSVCCPHW